MFRALVTGVSGNVGEAVSTYLAADNWQVIGVSRTPIEDIEHYSLDLTDAGQVYHFCARQEPFNLVVMAHGTQFGITLDSSDFLTHYASVVSNNLTASVNLTHYLIAHRKLTKNALIVYFSSIQATQPRAGRSPYAIAKSGLEALARIVAVEQGPKVRAIALRLGQMADPMKGIVFTPEQLAAIQNKTVYPWPTALEVARFCLELYRQPGMSGNVIDFDSSHNLRIWP